MAVYGSVLESRLNLEFANEMNQFDMMIRESSVDVVLESKFSLKGIFEKIKELWGKFKNWVKEKFKKLRGFIDKILHKTKDELNKKIEKTETKSDKKSDDDPPNLEFSYNITRNRFSYSLINQLNKLESYRKFVDVFEHEEAGMNEEDGDGINEALDRIKGKLEEIKKEAEEELNTIKETDYSETKKIDVRIPFKNVPLDSFKSSLEKYLYNIKSATEYMCRKISELKGILNKIEDLVEDYEKNLKSMEDQFKELDKDTQYLQMGEKEQVGTRQIFILSSNCMKEDIVRFKSAISYLTGHSATLIAAANQNQQLFSRLITMNGLGVRPKSQTILSIEKQSTEQQQS